MKYTVLSASDQICIIRNIIRKPYFSFRIILLCARVQVLVKLQISLLLGGSRTGGHGILSAARGTTAQ